MTWIASALSDEDRAVAEEAGGGAFDEASRRGSPFRLRLVAHDPAAYDRYYNTVANPMLWFIQHRLWDLVRKPALDRAFHEAWHAGYAEVNRGFADAVADELAADPDATVFFHDYHLYLAPRHVRERLSGRSARALRPHPVGERRRLERAARRHALGRPRRLAGERPRRLSHRALAEAVRARRPRRSQDARDEDGRTPDLGRPGGAGRAGDGRCGPRTPCRA